MENLNEKSNMNQSKNKKKVLIAIFLLIIVAMGGTIYYLITKKADKDVFLYDNNATVGLMPGVDRESLLAQMQETVDKSAIAFSINSRPVLIDGYIDILFENPEGNYKDLTIEIFDNDSGDTIYKSKALKEGSYVSTVKINKDYTVGEHTITAYITAFDVDNHNLIGEAAAELILNVVD